MITARSCALGTFSLANRHDCAQRHIASPSWAGAQVGAAHQANAPLLARHLMQIGVIHCLSFHEVKATDLGVPWPMSNWSQGK
jgi:hypothetical protein